MPYIIEEERQELDPSIDKMTDAILNTHNPHNFASFLGRINYCFSRVLMKVMGKISYANVAMATGVLENVKQEFYERVARKYEDGKIIANGDIPEYK